MDATLGRYSTVRTLAMLVTAALVACNASKPPVAASSRVAQADQQGGDVSDDALGSGHLHLEGDVGTDADFAVSGCSIGKPGGGLLDGYRMNAEGGDSAITELALTVRNYVKDGSYTSDTSSESQMTEGMKSGSFGPLALMIPRPGSPVPMAFLMTPASNVVTTISNDGASGVVKITNMVSQVTAEDLLTNGAKAHGKTVSGSVTWKCGHVDHQSDAMSKVVDGMMGKLMNGALAAPSGKPDTTPTPSAP